MKHLLQNQRIFFVKTKQVFIFLGTFGLLSSGFANISFYVSAPGVQTVEETAGLNGDFLTETFNSLPDGSAANFTGANGGVYVNTSSPANGPAFDSGPLSRIMPGWWPSGPYNQGNFLSVISYPDTAPGYFGSEEITFSSGINYFGFLWTAGDAGNKITFYDTNNVMIGVYTTADLIDFLPNDNTTVKTAKNGEQYYTGNYWAKPTDTLPDPTVPPSEQNPPLDSKTEPYAYLHFLSDQAIGKIEFSQSIPAGFETDNHSVSTNASLEPNSSVLYVGAVVPEPSVVLLLLLGAGLFMLRRTRQLRCAVG